MLQNRKILVAITGGIAAYKACELVRLLMKNRASVQIAMTDAAARFVAPLTFEALTGKKVAVALFESEEEGRGHLDLVRDIDLMVIAPATANCVGKLAAGIADDLVSTAALALACPLLICPAMNPKMYAHPAVQENLQMLKKRGVRVMDPVAGAMAHPAEEPGMGRLPEPQDIFDRICRLLPPVGPLTGMTVTVTAGPTCEAIDPVRVISNLSSGRLGYALAEEARRRGAQVHLIAGPGARSDPPGLTVERVESTADLLKAVKRRFPKSRILIMAAAPSDFRARQANPQKIKKEAVANTLSLELEKTPDILKNLSSRKGNRLVVGFALETGGGIANARRKLKEKNLDLIVLNHPRSGSDVTLGGEMIQGTLIDSDGGREVLPVITKEEFAAVLLDRIQKLLPGLGGGSTPE